MRRTLRPRGRTQARSFVLIAVLAVVGCGLLVATGVLFLVQAELAGEANSREATQSRATAWSAVQVVMSRLDDQRDRILDGDVPRLQARFTLYETDRLLGVARLLPLAADGGVLVPEAGRLDLATVDAATLAATGMVDAALAEAVITHRDQQLGRPFQSVAELLDVPGMTPETLYGPLEDVAVMDQALGMESELGERVGQRLEDDAPRGLADVVTVYAFEPAIQRSGRRRINLDVPWSEELGRRVEDRFGEGASDVLRGLFEQGTSFDSEASIFRTLRRLGMTADQWPEIVDTVTTEAGPYHFGRLDLNTASLAALVALPGLDAEQASQIVRTRDVLSDELRATVAWPAIEGIVEPAAYEELAARITTRSWTYRFRVAAGEVDADDPDSPLRQPVILEAVVDLASPEPRLAYLRDITLLQTAAMLTAAMPGEEEDEATQVDGPADDVPAATAREDTPTAPPPNGEMGDDAATTRRPVGRWLTGRSARRRRR